MFAGEINNETARARAAEAGSQWFMIGVLWQDIEPSEPTDGVHTYDWSRYDTIFANGANAGLKAIAVIGGSPQWAVEDMPTNPATGQHYNCGPIDEEDLDDFATFVQALVERYDGDGGIDDGPGYPAVPYWEFWNEPDGMGPKGLEFNGCWGGYSESDSDWDNDGMSDPEEYARMLSYAYPAVKVANSEAKVSFGAIAYDRSYSVTWFNLDFTDQVLAALTDPAQYPDAVANNYYFDVMNFHAYSNPVLAYNWNPPNLLGKARGEGVYNTFKNANYMTGRPSVRGLLTNHGLDKPLICSEIGRASGADDPQLNVDPSETNEGQSRYVVRGFTHGMTLWPDEMEVVIWYTLVDYLAHAGKKWGLLCSDSVPGSCDGLPHLSRKSSWYAYQTVASELGWAQYSGPMSGSGIEGYIFTMPGGSEKTVLWVPPDEKARPGSSTTRDFAVASGQQLRVVRMYEVSPGSDEWRWEEVLIPDGGSGDLDGDPNNGQVRIQIDSNPQFVELVPK